MTDRVRGPIVWFTDRPASGKSTLATALRPMLVYRQAQAGQIANFTGLSDPYEEPEHPDVVIHTDAESVATSVARVGAELRARGLV
ncbi:MAG TPA: adenylyl-sulfate kinase [Polyangia bacterium]|jgi:Adenylylsulfate kinase and related kinases|nr:adenylyl-sulfate kinase [Polyangia bacterium]